MEQPHKGLLDLPQEILERIFRPLLVPGCIEQRRAAAEAPLLPLSQLPGLAVTETFLIYTHRAKPQEPQLWRFRPMEYSRALMDRNFVLRTQGNRYAQHQLDRNPKPGIGPHVVTLCDLNQPRLNRRGMDQIKKNAVCSCGYCQWRYCQELVPGSSRRWDAGPYVKGTDEFFAPLLVCRDLYFRLREMFFKDNVFAFGSPCDLSRFLERLAPWQRDLVRKVQIPRAGVVIVFPPRCEDKVARVWQALRPELRAVSHGILGLQLGESHEPRRSMSLDGFL